MVLARLNKPKNKFASTSRPSGRKANASGYVKRQARKPSSDVYEYAPQVLRRSNVTLDLNQDEAAEYGVNIHGGNDENPEELRARLIGENVENEGIESGDDEEIDSDAAFEESDEERFAGFFSNKGKKKALKKKPVVRFTGVDLNEDENMEDIEEQRSSDNSGGDQDDDEEEEGEDDEFIDLLDVLDGKGEIEFDTGSDAPKPTENRASKTREACDDAEEADEEVGGREESDEEGEDDYDDSEEEHSMDINDQSLEFMASDTEDAVPEALDELQNFISALNPTARKRKTIEGTGTSLSTPLERSRKQRRLSLKERTEAGAENEFRPQNSGSKLNLDDLLAPLASQPSSLLSLKKSTKALGPSSSKVKTLSAPLPQRTKERLDREAAYEQTKEEVDKWSGTMKRIREAEHLSFPLQTQPTGKVSNLELAAKFKPTTALESSVDALLKSAKLRDEDIQHTEEAMLQMNKISVEEVAQRRAELRKMRELMFRAEVKAKRIAKIKSKTYRKIKRKEREKLGEKLGEGQESETEEGRLKREVDRARERATLRHKHTGKWAKQMQGREGDEQGRKDIEEMLDRGEKLRRRIKGMGSDEESAEEEDDDDDEGGENVVDKVKQVAFDELQKIDREDRNTSTEQNGTTKSIFGMKFMKDAMTRQQQNADRMADDFIKEIGTSEDIPEDSETEDVIPHDMETSSRVVAVRTGGRVAYRPGVNTTHQQVIPRPIASLASDTSSVTLKSTDPLSPPTSPNQQRRSSVLEPSITKSNPWLAPQAPGVAMKGPRKHNEILLSKDSAPLTKSKNKLKKQAKKREEEKEKEKDDAVVEISMDNVLSLGVEASAPTLTTKGTKHNAAVSQKGPTTKSGTADNDSDANSEVEAQEKILDLKGRAKTRGPKAFEQRDLVALAFAGDNVVHEFEEAKRREVAADAPREVDTTIPGWGSWGGAGTRKAPPQPQRIKKIAGVDPRTRADFGKAHVIISEKRDKKAAKYLVKDLPYPYTSKAQFDRTMEQPLGTEWNTRLAFQRGTLPRVVKKPGMVINPLEKLS